MNGLKTTLLMVTLTLMLIAVGEIPGGKTGISLDLTGFMNDSNTIKTGQMFKRTC